MLIRAQVLGRCFAIPTRNGIRHSSSGPSITDQMIQYINQECKGKHDQAMDILRSGFNLFPNKEGLDFARLMATAASIETDRCNWDDVLSCSRQAASALQANDVRSDPAAASTLFNSGSMMLRALLLLGQDSEAKTAADTTAEALATLQPSCSTAGVASLGLQLSSRHAAASWEPALQAAEQLVSASQQCHGAVQHGTPPLGLSRAFAALGQWHAAQRGAGPEAEAEAKAAFERGAQSGPETSSFEGSLEEAEARAACLVGQAGIAARASEWDQAEDCLGKALQVAEGISTDTHPRVVPILAQLGYVYSRSARVTFAEGLYRECAKILKIDLAREATWHLQPPPLHANLVAMLAWRFYQLLAVMPNRGSEASRWEQLAQATWANTIPASNEDTLSATFGGPKHLSGQDHAGAGMVVALQFRRGLPVHFGMGV